MGFYDLTAEKLNRVFTENGDAAFKSTLSPTLDYFALIGGKRFDLKGAAVLFLRALIDDPVTALKLLFYTRDPRHGIGERRLFRFLFSSYCLSYPNEAAKLLPLIQKYGRYDDYFAAFGTPVEDDAFCIIEEQLNADIAAKKEGKPISLLAKWMPSINTSSGDARHLALVLSKKLGMTPAEYRKTLSFLRKDLIVENSLREKDYTFDYASVPSLAMHKYAKAFTRNDKDRFGDYLKRVEEGKAKMNVSVADPVSLVRRFRAEHGSKDFDESYFETAWKAMVEESSINKKTIVVRDGSGSMLWGSSSPVPLEIADAMALLTAARLKGEFHNKFITFSSSPELVDLSKTTTLWEQVQLLSTYNDCSNTNIQKVYDLVLDVYRDPRFKKEDAVNQILIISDMEFDAMQSPRGESGDLMSTFEHFNEEFKKLGYPRPEVVFWNVNARHQSYPVTQNEAGVKLVSGASKNVIEMVSMTDSLDPKDFMDKVLRRYQDVEELLKEGGTQ